MSTTERPHRAPLIDESTDPRKPGNRLGRLLDAEDARPMHAPDDSGVSVATGRVEGVEVVAYCTDASTMGGALGAAAGDHIVDAIDEACARGCPVIGVWHSGGARLADGVESLHGMGRIFHAISAASGRTPQISVVLGPAAGAAAYGPALTDVVIVSDEARVFVTGPGVLRAVTGEEIDMEELGGPDTHGSRSGVAHVVAGSEDSALDTARRLARMLDDSGRRPHGTPGPHPDPAALLPESARKAYDVHPLVCSLLDSGTGFEEIQAGWARSVVVGLGRLGGSPVGFIANNPIRRGGCLDSSSAEKAARFVRMCDSLGVPLVVLVDVPGYLPGVEQEWSGVVRRGAKLLHAFAEAVVPRVTVITRKAYGGAYIAMNARSLGANKVYAWPGAEVAVMGPEAAVDILHRKRLAEVPEPERDTVRADFVRRQRRDAGGVDRAIQLGVVDEIIDPAQTRFKLIEALAAETPLRAADRRRGAHTNIPL